MQHVEAAELVEQLQRSDGVDALADDPLVLIDGTDDPGAANGGTASPRSDLLLGLPAVVVARRAPDEGARGEGPGLADVVVADDEELAAVRQQVETHPLAAVALALLLRGASARAINDGLVAESSTYSLLQAGPEHRRWLDAQPSRPAPRPTADDDRAAVRVERHGDELRVTLARPEVRNAYSAAMRDGLLQALAVAEADRSLRVVLEAEGPDFCSGGDLREFGTTPDPATAHVIRLRRSAGRAVHGLAERVSVHVHGSCVGAGVELPSFAGHVSARADSRFWLPELAMGLVPGAGGTVSIERRVGRQRTAWLALTGRPIDAPTALAWGLIDAVT